MSEPRFPRRRRSRRLRKKLHLGEFQEFGLQIQLQFKTGYQTEAIWHEWISWLESQHLSFGGGGSDRHLAGFVTQNGHGSLTEQHRSQIQLWLSQQPWLQHAQVSELIDAWYG